ncbi:MAG: hypothetical protein H6736_22550 [Alphaproteobacteria bacterium]|nr:hypothetical protein [Alphaproteobacteria bacterium]MCB9694600.1 hypothetical protein [Alphaproteobacteria bacterium]
MRTIVFVATILGLSACTTERAARTALEEAGLHTVDLTRTSPVHFSLRGRNAESGYCAGDIEIVGGKSKWGWICQRSNPDPVCAPDRLEDCVDAVVAARKVDELAAIEPLRMLCVYNGHPMACRDLASVALDAEAWRTLAFATALACGRGDGPICEDLSFAAGRLEDWAAVLSYGSHACDLGRPIGCGNARAAALRLGLQDEAARLGARSCELDASRCPGRG